MLCEEDEDGCCEE